MTALEKITQALSEIEAREKAAPVLPHCNYVVMCRDTIPKLRRAVHEATEWLGCCRCGEDQYSDSSCPNCRALGSIAEILEGK